MLKILLTLSLVALYLPSFTQINPTQAAQPLVAEGKLLYRCEMASWYGTDLFLEKYKETDKVGGYLSYMDGDTARCIFFSRGDTPRVLGTMSFDSTYNTTQAVVDMGERSFTALEQELYMIRKLSLIEIGRDTMFRTYKNTALNLIPLKQGLEKKVYILTGPRENGVVIFGNDYLITFDGDNNIIAKRQLHKNIIPINTNSNEVDGKLVIGTMHSHLPETGEFITATDVCTLMLYAKMAGWKTHQVVTPGYLNIWSCETNQLTVISRETVNRVNEDDKKQKRKKKKD